MKLKKKILGTELIKRFPDSQIQNENINLFKKDFLRIIKPSYKYVFKKITILSNGIIQTNNNDFIKEFLGFSSISKFSMLKKIILYLIYKLKTFSAKKTTFKIKGKNFFIIYNRSSKGYFHWITDTLIKIQYIKSRYKNFVLIFPETFNKKIYKDSLNELKIKYFFLKKKNYLFDKLTYIGELYPSGSPRPLILKKFAKKIRINKKNSLNIYISRNRSNRRLIENEKELKKVLKIYNFKTVYMEKLSFKDQIKLMSKTNIILGLHGAGLTNMLWLKKNSVLLELKPENDKYLNCYYNISKILGLKYFYSICKKNSLFVNSKNANYKVNINDLKNKLKLIIQNEN